MISTLRLIPLALGLATVVLGARDKTYPACDYTKSKHGPGSHQTYTTDQSPFWVKAGLGACNVDYNDNIPGACVNPGWVNSANLNRCGQKIQAKNLSNGKTTTVLVLDVCGAVPDSTFGCNDIAFTRSAFVALGGDPAVGNLGANVEWKFVQDA